ncbi:hypothetical protein OF376_00320 [Ureaplasma miroungigenitalium]|uniref:Inhibitor of apoptosis-promoting Bax1 n=1 Tax=Ureaplasma miroungigenitalium TaxID=1042321 RepID=A0ABT3BLW1_9BACT|nr:hypothetical protein [Ureaplasma miroungigenitalium]MCV3728235.1 hypothetical protein [Ureaplasma miroungigenitalium]MCV3734039.1 hypothetical protein [Ureaplasma miroungigenitalium]
MNFWKVQKEPLNQKESKLLMRVLGISLIQTLIFTGLLTGLVFLFQYGLFNFDYNILVITYSAIAGANLISLFIMYLINMFTRKFQYSIVYNVFYSIFLTLGFGFLLSLMIGYLYYYTFLVLLGSSILIYIIMMVVGFIISRKGSILLYRISTAAIIAGLVLLGISFIAYFIGFRQYASTKGPHIIDLLIAIAFCIGIVFGLIVNIGHVKLTCALNPDNQHRGFMLHLSNILYRAYIQVVVWIFIIFSKIRIFFD